MSCSTGSIQKEVPRTPPQKYSPTEPGNGHRPASVRTAKPRPKPIAGFGRRIFLGRCPWHFFLDRPGGAAHRRGDDAGTRAAALLPPFAPPAGLWRPRRADSRLSGLVEGRADVERRRPAQIARVAVVMRPAAMHRAAVVPDHQIADPPFVAVDEFGPGRVRIEVVEQQATLGHRPTDDVRGVRREV